MSRREFQRLEAIACVLALKIGEGRVLREEHLCPCTVHRYREGWTILRDNALNRTVIDEACLGWFFEDPQSVTDFLSGVMPIQDRNQAVIRGGRA
jgi:hypothetical protein